ncbi:hypothetical protein MRX96_038202 [Rhipicephalus microplus]
MESSKSSNSRTTRESTWCFSSIRWTSRLFVLRRSLHSVIRVQEFKALNAEVVACSVDSPFTHLAWINTPRKQGGLGPIKIPLLSDLTHQISKDYGVYLEDLGHTLRGLFIIDDKGNLRQITMNDMPVGRSVDETLRLVQAFQYTDKHGEVCPAGWKPGGDTIIPTPSEKLKYFQQGSLIRSNFPFKTSTGYFFHNMSIII